MAMLTLKGTGAMDTIRVGWGQEKKHVGEDGIRAFHTSRHAIKN